MRSRIGFMMQSLAFGRTGSAIGDRGRRLVRAQHVHGRKSAVQLSRANVRTSFEIRIQRHDSALESREVDPAGLMRLYKKAGAKYFVSMGVHHDNFDMWNSKYQRWNATIMGPKKDVVGLWHKAAKVEGLKFGVTDHLWITYKWFSVSHGHDGQGPYAGVPYDGANPQNADLYVASDDVWARDLDWNEAEYQSGGTPLVHANQRSS